MENKELPQKLFYKQVVKERKLIHLMKIVKMKTRKQKKPKKKRERILENGYPPNNFKRKKLLRKILL
jgi:hypothetical protein